MDVWERGIEGIGVVLDGSKKVLSDAQGNYRFNKVPNGNHTVSVFIGKESSGLSAARDGRVSISVKDPVSYRVDLPVTEAGELKIEIQLKNR